MTNLEEGLAAYENSDFITAFRVLTPLAKNGNIQAQKFIAYMYDFGKGVEPNINEAIKWYRLAAQQGDPISQNNLAALLLDKYPEEAIQFYTLAAEQGLPFAQEVLGDIYSGHMAIANSSGNLYRDDIIAIEWYTKVARRGGSMASHRLGDMYRLGQGVNQNMEKAVFWYTKAAENDYLPSQKVLAVAYQQGLLGLSQNEELAKYWMEKYNY